MRYKIKHNLTHKIWLRHNLLRSEYTQIFGLPGNVYASQGEISIFCTLVALVKSEQLFFVYYSKIFIFKN
ncbi:hypothetical protein BpHYR1_035783 [Brachionus plicatilis]|uniref:Uncharacterized protein n=1 Tax=Brachionus plicatilis TaxID=10195 RepID=A0A3M7RFA8_BRAPC|nr:hypothetical protein BpHYR1_035783 [Brachionus plicatilis]